MEERVRFQILGPTRLRVGPKEIAINSIRDRMFLATLILRVGEPVPAPYLVDAIWGERPPRDSRSQLHGCVWRLRRLLVDAGGSRLLIATDPAGYRLVADPTDVDLGEFRQLREAARRATADGDRATASQRYRAALALWRAPALAEIESDVIKQSAAALDEEHIQAVEECYDVELADGKADELIPELTERVHQHPYRERLHGALMLALYRAGRQSDALAAYRNIRQTLLDQLGAEPGTALQELHRAILNQDSSLDIRPHQPAPQPSAIQMDFKPATPRTLPPDIADFVGREKEVGTVLDILTSDEGRGAPVVVITGPAGVGKTALSVRVAYELRPTYQDGQLYVDLHGFDTERPVEPFDALGRFLRSLGVDGGAMPTTLDERAELYRNLLADRAVLIILDNAASDNQVLPLVPAGDTCGVLISSRVRVGIAIGAKAINLAALDPVEATALVAQVVGPKRITSEPNAVDDLIDLCGRLPLAVRVAAGRLTSRPHWSVASLVARLRDERTRLDQLTHGPLDVRASIMLSYQSLGPEARQLIRRLGDLNLSETGPWVSAALLDTSYGRAEDILEQLFDAQLVEVTSQHRAGSARYRLHDLVRIFAMERANIDDSPKVLSAARQRVAACCLSLVTESYHAIYGGNYQNIVGTAPRWAAAGRVTEAAAQPSSWFKVEQQTIVEIIERAARDGQTDIAWELACTASPMFQMLRHFDDWERVLLAAYACVDVAGDSRGKAAMLYRLGWLYTDRTDYEAAKRAFQESTQLFGQLRDRHGIATVTTYLGMIERFLGRPDAAMQHYAAAQQALHEVGDRGGEAFALRGVGQLHLGQGNEALARNCFDRALEIYRACGCRQGEAQVTAWQGMLRVQQERFSEAQAHFQTALNITRAIGDRPGEAQCLYSLGLCYQRQGNTIKARESFSHALTLVRQPRPTHLALRIREALEELK